MDHLRRSLHGLGSKGRSGTEALWTLLKSRDGGRPSESPRELDLARALVAAGLPKPTLQYELRDQSGRLVARFDGALLDAHIGLEFNSYRHHYGREAWARDQRRLNGAAACGWLVFVFTDEDLRDPGSPTIADVRQAYETRRGRDER